MPTPTEPLYIGMRASSDEFAALEDDGFKYQLINGVVVTSPSPGKPHQLLFALLVHSVVDFVLQNEVGIVLPDTDVRFDAATVYRPDIAYFLSGRQSADSPANNVVPDLIIEIVSPSSGRMDFQTKRSDYERFGVREYWIVTPDPVSIVVLRLRNGRFEQIPVAGDRVASEVITGFVLDVAALRKVMKGR